METQIHGRSCLDITYHRLSQDSLLHRQSYSEDSDAFWKSWRADKDDKHGARCLPVVISLFGVVDPMALKWLRRAFHDSYKSKGAETAAPSAPTANDVPSVDSANMNNDNDENDVSAECLLEMSKARYAQREIRRLVQKIVISTWKHNYKMYRTAASAYMSAHPLMFQGNNGSIYNNSNQNRKAFCGL